MSEADAGAGPAGRGLARLSLSAKVGYGLGALLDGVATQAVNIFLLFYATAVCGLSAALTGVALAAGLMVDAVIDPLIGSLSDGWRSRWGRRAPFMLVGAPATLVFLCAIFSLPRGWTPVALFAWLTALSVGLRCSISLFLLPYNAVGSELSDDYAERSSIAAWRWAFTTVGALVTILLGFSVFLAGPGGLSRREGYTPFAAVSGAVALMGALVAVRTLLTLRERTHAPVDAQGSIHQRLRAELREVFRNPSFRVLFLGATLLFSAAAIHSSLEIHANGYFWRMQPKQIQGVTLALFLGLLCGAPLAAPMLRRLEKRTVLVVGVLGLALAFALPPTGRLLGLAPFGGPAPVPLLAAIVFAGGALMACAAIAFASMMGDAADEHEHLFGARREGLYFAGWAFAAKAASGVGSLVAGVGLQLAGFPAHAAGAAAAPAATTVAWIGVIYGPVAGLLGAAAALTCLAYRLNAQAHARILADLTARRTLRSTS